MERKILFKAKRLSDGKWMKGDLVHRMGKAYIYSTFEDMSGSILESIDPSTVCQFTGLKDKDGKEVWEHDYIATPCFQSEITCVRGSFVMENDIGLIPLIELYATEDDTLKYVENLGSKFDREEGEK